MTKWGFCQGCKKWTPRLEEGLCEMCLFRSWQAELNRPMSMSDLSDVAVIFAAELYKRTRQRETLFEVMEQAAMYDKEYLEVRI